MSKMEPQNLEKVKHEPEKLQQTIEKQIPGTHQQSSRGSPMKELAQQAELALMCLSTASEADVTSGGKLKAEPAH